VGSIFVLEIYIVLNSLSNQQINVIHSNVMCSLARFTCHSLLQITGRDKKDDQNKNKAMLFMWSSLFVPGLSPLYFYHK
jgi:hypothetical protein